MSSGRVGFGEVPTTVVDPREDFEFGRFGWSVGFSEL